MPCAIPSSRAQSSGTSPRPRARAAVAGNSAVRSSVAVKMMLTRSSCSIALRSSISRTSACVLRVDLGLGVLVAGRRAPQRQQSHGWPGYSAALVAPAERGRVERPHLVGRQRPPRPGREASGRAADRCACARAARTGWPTAAHMRRTMRLRPSFTTISSAVVPALGLLHEPHARGLRRAVVELDAVAQRAQRAPASACPRPRRSTPSPRRGSDA